MPVDLLPDVQSIGQNPKGAPQDLLPDVPNSENKNYFSQAKDYLSEIGTDLKNNFIKNWGAPLTYDKKLSLNQNFENNFPGSNEQILGAAVGGPGMKMVGQAAMHIPQLLKTALTSATGATVGYGLGGEKGAAVGSLLPLAGRMLPGGAKRAALSMVEDVTPQMMEHAQSRLDAAERLGLSHLRPSEALEAPAIATREGRLGRTAEGSQLLYGKQQERFGTEQKSIENLLDTIYNEEKLGKSVSADQKAIQTQGTLFNDEEELGPIDRLYRQAEQQRMPQGFVDKLKESKVMQQAFNKVETSPTYQDKLKGVPYGSNVVPENSIGYLDKVKRALNDMQQGHISAGNRYEASIAGQLSKMLTKHLDEISPEYKQARALAQRQITRRNIEEALARRSTKGRIGGQSFYNIILNNDKKFNDLNRSLKNVPEAQQQLKDMRMLFKDLISPNNVRSAAKLSETGMVQARNPIDAIKDFVGGLLQGRFDKESIELITNPKWKDQIRSILEKKNTPNKYLNMASLLGRVGTSAGYGIANTLDQTMEGR